MLINQQFYSLHNAVYMYILKNLIPDNEIRDEGATVLAEALKQNTALTLLRLNGMYHGFGFQAGL